MATQVRPNTPGAQHEFIKAPMFANTAIALLERELVIANTLWRWAASDFTGALDDTINVKVPGRLKAQDRDLRATGEDRRIKMDYVKENKIGVKLTKFPYSATSITDEQLNLDITDFGTQILAPQVRAMQEYIETMAVNLITKPTDLSGSTVAFGDGRFDFEGNLVDQTKIKGTLKMEDFYGPGKMGAHALFNRLHTIFTLRGIPSNDRVVLAGAEVAEEIRNAPNLVYADQAGDSNALRDATIGKLSGFTIIETNNIPTNEMYAFHKSAFVLATAAPLVPQGAVYGASQSTPETALRWLRDYDAEYAEDRSVVDCFAGTGIVQDFDEKGQLHFMRAVKITADLNKVAKLRADAGNNPVAPAA